MELENITITATIEGDPVMVVLDSDQRKMLPDLIANCDKSGACRVARLNSREYTLSSPSLVEAKNMVEKL